MKKGNSKAKLILFFALIVNAALLGGEDDLFLGNRFYFAQIRYAGNWDPHPGAAHEILHFLSLNTSVDPMEEKKSVDPASDDIFYCPFLYLAGGGKFTLPDAAVKNLRRHLERGGLLWIDEAEDEGFRESVQSLVKRIFPDKNIERIPGDSVIFYSFYLLPEAGGRRRIRDYIEGVSLDGRWALVYSRNDLSGGWVRDRLGNWQYPCIPDGERQRWEGIKLTVNIIMYALCDTYKLDKIHREYLDRKLE